MKFLEFVLQKLGKFKDPTLVKRLQTVELEDIVNTPHYAEAWLVTAAKEELELRAIDFARHSDRYRLYANGDVIHEDDFSLWDNSLPYYDDYGEYQVPHDTVHMLKLHERGILPAEIVKYVLDEEKEIGY